MAVFNMGTELGGALSVFGTAVAGNLVSLNPGFSMGGITPASSNLLGNLLGLLGTLTLVVALFVAYMCGQVNQKV